MIWAACTLTKAKLYASSRNPQYPLAYYRAACLIWVTAARRSDEIRRLSLGCVSRAWAPEMRDEQGNQVEPAQELCYLRVPTNKMRVMRDKLRKVNPPAKQPRPFGVAPGGYNAALDLSHTALRRDPRG